MPKAKKQTTSHSKEYSHGKNDTFYFNTLLRLNAADSKQLKLLVKLHLNANGRRYLPYEGHNASQKFEQSIEDFLDTKSVREFFAPGKGRKWVLTKDYEELRRVFRALFKKRGYRSCRNDRGKQGTRQAMSPELVDDPVVLNVPNDSDVNSDNAGDARAEVIDLEDEEPVIKPETDAPSLGIAQEFSTRILNHTRLYVSLKPLSRVPVPFSACDNYASFFDQVLEAAGIPQDVARDVQYFKVEFECCGAGNPHLTMHRNNYFHWSEFSREFRDAWTQPDQLKGGFCRISIQAIRASDLN